MHACLLKTFRIDVAAVQETHSIWAVDCRVLEKDFNVFQHTPAALALGSLC